MIDDSLSMAATMSGAALTRSAQSITPPQFKLLPASGCAPAVKGEMETGKQIWSSTKKRSSVENAFKQWKDHKEEFPELQNSKQYVEKAWNFLKFPSKDVLSKTRSKGDVTLSI